MHPILFQIGQVTIYSHGFLIIIGVVLATILVYFLAGYKSLDQSRSLDNISTVVLVGIIASRLTYDLVFYNQLKSFWEAFYIWQGGLVSWGGFIVGFLVLIYLLKRQKQPQLKWLDILSLSTLAGIAIGRIGCTLTRDIAGKVTTSYSHGFPVAAYESILTAALFIVLLTVYLRVKKLPDGFLFYYAIIGYSLVRLIIDGFRDAATVFLGLNASQITAALVIVIVMAAFMIRIFGRRKK